MHESYWRLEYSGSMTTIREARPSNAEADSCYTETFVLVTIFIHQ